jgi:peptidoglycan/LPS O-acetylase OafA/YrhL
MKQPVGCLTQNDDYIVGSIGRYWNVGFSHLVYFVCPLVYAKMTKIAIRTAWVALFIVLVVLAYGHGYKSGRNAQLDFADVLKIAKSQFTCTMENK